MSIRIGSICTGYGGLDMAVHQVIGGTLAWYAEIEPHPARLLARRFPGVPNLGDITTVDWQQTEPIDVLVGGYPCQPFSSAGKKLGVNDERHLWPFIRDGIRILRPRLSVFENVAAHLTRGFSTVLRDCAQDGFNVRWLTVGASEAGAPHSRERLFFVVTDPTGEGLQGDCLQPVRHVEAGECAGLDDGVQGFQWGEYTEAVDQWSSIIGRNPPHPVEMNKNGRPRPTALFYEWMMGLPQGWITDPELGIPWSHQIKLCGNGVVPQQAELALRMLLSDREVIK